ncbi:helix-turn-helix domain-containing protein [Streptomyces sp. NPDC057654]|uniref:helix-turn-helix domain-containing protein n=1 Tax=Streptomyces sp. NPDC057654 TaxID=3346196 RepID=UPI003683C781
MVTPRLAPGANLAAVRKARGLKQEQLARKASISVSLLSKIEVGDRTLTPEVAALMARAIGITMAEVLGTAPVEINMEAELLALRSAVRDYDLPETREVDERTIARDLKAVGLYRDSVDIDRLMPALPGYVRNATAHAFAANTAQSWAALSDMYSAVYWLAARHRWMDMAELAVTRQRWAVEQKRNPLAAAVAARDRAGAYLNSGSLDKGLTIVDRAIAAAQNGLSGQQRAFAIGVLNLRGMTLAGRIEDKREAKQEAARHIKSAWKAADEFGADHTLHNMIFGPGNTVTHLLATQVDLGQPQEAVRVAADLDAALTGLPPVRVAASRINLARAQLDLGDRDGALENLATAWGAAPQMARLNPMGQEVFRVLTSLHKRSNARLLALSKLSGVEL